VRRVDDRVRVLVVAHILLRVRALPVVRSPQALPRAHRHTYSSLPHAHAYIRPASSSSGHARGASSGSRRFRRQRTSARERER